VTGLAEATALAEQLLQDRVPRRWDHSLGVLRRAESLAPALGDDAELLAAAAIVHDVGYAPEAIATRQHMIDGARYLADVVGLDPLLCSVVAYHSSSRWEAAELGLAKDLARFTAPPQLLEDAITWCDLSTTPDGGEVDPVERLDEVLQRYGPDHVVFRAVTAARPFMLASVQRINDLRQRAATR
jgi:putative nucleotidyltransferase with HDIG domain